MTDGGGKMWFAEVKWEIGIVFLGIGFGRGNSRRIEVRKVFRDMMAFRTAPSFFLLHFYSWR